MKKERKNVFYPFPLAAKQHLGYQLTISSLERVEDFLIDSLESWGWGRGQGWRLAPNLHRRKGSTAE